MSLALSDYVTFQLILFIPYSLMRGFSFFFFSPRMGVLAQDVLSMEIT